MNTNVLRMCVLSYSVISDSLHPTDCGPAGFSVHEISQARMLEWVATSSSRGSSRLRIKPALAGRFFTPEPAGEPKHAGTRSELSHHEKKDQDADATQVAAILQNKQVNMLRPETYTRFYAKRTSIKIIGL